MTMLPESLQEELKSHLHRVRELHERDVLAGFGEVWLPVKALGAHCRTLFKTRLQKEHPQLFAQVPEKVWQRHWNVDSRAAGSGENALRYLARYVFKTATGNRPVQVLPDGQVRWTYRESETGRPAALHLPPLDFMARFLQHILPRGFARVRTFGWLHPAAKVRANRVRALLRQPPVLTPAEQQTWQPPGNPEPALPGSKIPGVCSTPPVSALSPGDAVGRIMAARPRPALSQATAMNQPPPPVGNSVQREPDREPADSARTRKWCAEPGRKPGPKGASGSSQPTRQGGHAAFVRPKSVRDGRPLVGDQNFPQRPSLRKTR